MAIKLPMKFEDALSDLLKVKSPPKEKPKAASTSDPPPPAPKEKPYKRKPFPDEIPVPPDEAYWDEPA